MCPDYDCEHFTCDECCDHCVDYDEALSHAVDGGYQHCYVCQCGAEFEWFEDYSSVDILTLPKYEE